MSVVTLYHSFQLPWSYIAEEVERLKRLVITVMAVAVILGLIVPFIPVPKVDRDKVEELPPRLAQLVMEKKKPKPPPPKKVEKKKEKKKEEKKKEKKKEEKKKEKPKPKKKEVKKKPEKTEAQKMAEARKKAKSSGILQFADELADLRDAPVKTALNKNKLSKGGAEAKTFKRDILTSGVSTGSGGINTSNLSTGIGRRDLAGRETTKVESEIDKVAMASRVEKDSSSKKPSRTYEEVSLVFDKNKGSIYSLYGRALRKDPTLEGKVVIELTISPDGQVTSIRIVSSELNNAALERKLMARIKLFNFGSKNVEELIVTYPIDFLPP